LISDTSVDLCIALQSSLENFTTENLVNFDGRTQFTYFTIIMQNNYIVSRLNTYTVDILWHLVLLSYVEQ